MDTTEVENFLDCNPVWSQEYFLRKADTVTVNKWLHARGLPTIQDSLQPGPVRKESASQDSSGQTSPDSRSGDVFFQDGRHQRSNSKKHLRHDFARSKMRSMFRTHESSFAQSRERGESTLADRRSSLKGMRQFLSLPPTSGNILSMLIQSKVRLPRYASKDEEIKRELRDTNERDFLLEIVRDISHDLDLKRLTSRILVNIGIMMNADRCSLFLVEGPKGKQTLVSKVFDVYTGTSCILTTMGDNMVRIPWGQGIIGHVAETGKAVNITKASQDPRYKDDVDKMTGFTTDSLLCMPIKNPDDDVIGVAQVINKNTADGVFDQDDQKLLETYLAFCGMAISNAQAIDLYSREYDRNRALLEVVHGLFEEQTSVDKVVMKIMQRAQALHKCERCIVMLKEGQDNSAPDKSGFSRVFDLQQSNRNGQCRYRRDRSCSPKRGNKIADIVASTGETINISQANNNQYVDIAKDDFDGFQTQSVLCKPIRNADFRTIGVAQLINKLDGGTFDENDEELFEAFTIFCGLGINNCQLYDEITRSAAKQAVALEVLSYHATETSEDLSRIKNRQIPERSVWKLDQMTGFNDFSLDTDQMVLASIRIFTDTGLLKAFKMDYDTLVRWLLTVRKNYRSVAYHNWRHAYNVCQTMFNFINVPSIKKALEDVECLALLVACLCHDLDHRGTNNAFQEKTCSPLSQLYGTQATLEHHHFNHAVMILNSEGHNIFATLSSESYSRVMQLLKDAIIATDISRHIQVRQKFFSLVDSGMFSWEDREQKDTLRNVLMTACDIATITKPWPVQRKAADLVMAEFFDQGDKEKNVLKIQPQANMDRERQDELPRLQIEWIDGICFPLYKSIAKMDPTFQGLLDQVVDNRAHWEILDEHRLATTVARETHV